MPGAIRHAACGSRGMKAMRGDWGLKNDRVSRTADRRAANQAELAAPLGAAAAAAFSGH